MIHRRANDRLSILRFFWIPLLILGTAGCHDHSALEKQIADLRKELEQVRTVQGNNGVMVEDLDNRLLLVQDQVDTNRLVLGSTAPPPALPVVRLHPENMPIYPAEVVYPAAAIEAPYGKPLPQNTDRIGAEKPLPQAAVVETEEPLPQVTGTIEYQMLDEYGDIVGTGDHTAGLAAAPEPPPVRSAPKTKPVDGRSDNTRALTLYKKGMALLKEKRHREAVAMFEDFLSQFPNHDYADNCTYWIGEAHYDRQMYNKALAHFEQVVVQYPRGNKVPDAMLKAAFCYTSLGIRDRARELCERLIQTYPGSRAARLAEKRKAELL